MTGRVMVYGATGFSGAAIARRLRETGVDIILAARNEPPLRELAAALESPFRVFDLRDAAVIARALADVQVVVHAAGPFVHTAAPMIEACLRSGSHYLDIAGEWPVFALAQRRGIEAAKTGIMLMPGAGFSIAVTDCLLAHAARRCPDAVRLRLAVAQPMVVSRGTFRTTLELTAGSALVREEGVVIPARVGGRRTFNYGSGERESIAVSWPDVITGQQTTGVGNIETYLEAPAPFELLYRSGALAAEALGERNLHGMLWPLGRLWPDQPSSAAQQRAVNALVVEAVDPWRRVTRFGFHTADGYGITTTIVAAIVARVLTGVHRTGFLTPAGMYGADFVTNLGCAWPYDATVGVVTPRGAPPP